jgi:hypothetical protein
MRRLHVWLIDVVFGVLLICVTGASAAVVWDENTNGDLSNDRLNPTSINLTEGTNSLVATMPGADLDYLTIVVPANSQFSALTPTSYVSSDGTSFIGMQAGTQMTVPTNTPSASGLLGWAHFGTGPGNVNQDILPAMGTSGAGATGFTPPLSAGSYTFWIQQASTASVSYQFDFLVTSLAVPTGD